MFQSKSCLTSWYLLSSGCKADLCAHLSAMCICHAFCSAHACADISTPSPVILIRSALRASTMLRSSNAPGKGELFLDAMQSLTVICLPNYHSCSICCPSLYNKVQPVWFSSAVGMPCQENSGRIGNPATASEPSQCRNKNANIANTAEAIFSSSSPSVQQKGTHNSQVASGVTPLTFTATLRAPSVPSLAAGSTPRGPTSTPLVPSMTPPADILRLPHTKSVQIGGGYSPRAHNRPAIFGCHQYHRASKRGIFICLPRQ